MYKKAGTIGRLFVARHGLPDFIISVLGDMWVLFRMLVREGIGVTKDERQGAGRRL